MLAQLFTWLKSLTPATATPTRRTHEVRPELENLEAREVPAVVSVQVAVYSGERTLDIRSDTRDSNVTITQSGSVVTVRDTINNSTRKVTLSAPLKAVQFVGNSGKDTVTLSIAGLSLRAWGYGNNDYLRGNSGADRLYGGAGNDTLLGSDGADTLYGGTENDYLSGGNANDRLFGEAGQDTLYGGDHNDYLHGGANTDTVNGGNGVDTFRRNLAMAGQGLSLMDDENAPADEPTQVAGAFLTERVSSSTRDSFWAVDQAGSPTCAFLASLAAYAERTGASDDLVQGIQYKASTDQYGIQLYVNSAWRTYWVNGDWTEGRDPGKALWVTLYQKAYLQAHGVQYRDSSGMALDSTQWKSPNGTTWRNSGHALDTLTPGYSKWTAIASASASTIRTQVYDDATQGMVASTKSSGTTNGVVANHAYMIYDAFTENGIWKIRLYNPWAHDGTGSSTDGSDNGMVTLTWAQFTANFTGYYRNS